MVYHQVSLNRENGTMFQAPSRTTTYTAPAEDIDINERYLFKLAKLEDEGVSKFADPAKGETFHNIRWHYRVALASDPSKPILDTEGKPWEHVEWTTSKTGKNPKSGVAAKARLWAEALIGHALEDDEIDDGLSDRILNKVASGLFEEKELTNQSGEVYTRLRIMRLSPLKTKAGAAPAPTPVPTPTPAPVAAAASDDLPF